MEHDANALRLLAQRTRKEAEQATDPVLRHLLLEAAADYERWVAVIEGQP